MRRMDLADNKLAILYFFDSLGIPLTNEQVTDFFVNKYLMNYFDLQQFLAELFETEHLCYMESRNSNFYSITERGKETLRLFSSRIDTYTRNMIEDFVLANRSRLKRESQLIADYKRLENNEYLAVLKVMEGTITLIELKLNLTTMEQAKSVCEKWKVKAPEVYKKIMESLI
ncbi:MAG TPA: DUF4364 family protein [Candidatus Atribacteria bacterium]|nr:DUF4364 family protein [Candidatus Atribacteria bacterium]HPT78288.1 DUF4364 family protein [Candidatus Atribacteria bacterium]